jgi:hypothetical protein
VAGEIFVVCAEVNPSLVNTATGLTKAVAAAVPIRQADAVPIILEDHGIDLVLRRIRTSEEPHRILPRLLLIRHGWA